MAVVGLNTQPARVTLTDADRADENLSAIRRDKYTTGNDEREDLQPKGTKAGQGIEQGGRGEQ